MIKSITNAFPFAETCYWPTPCGLLPLTPSSISPPVPYSSALVCSGNLAGRLCSYFQRSEWVRSAASPPECLCREHESMAHLLSVQQPCSPPAAPPPPRQRQQGPRLLPARPAPARGVIADPPLRSLGGGNRQGGLCFQVAGCRGRGSALEGQRLWRGWRAGFRRFSPNLQPKLRG